MQVRYRALSSRLDFAEVRRVRKALSARGDEDVASGLRALAEAPRQVSAKDGEADEEKVRAWLREGQLGLDDLVDVGNGWQTIRDCYLFDEVCSELEGGRSWRQPLYWVALVGGGLAALGLMLWASSQ